MSYYAVFYVRRGDDYVKPCGSDSVLRIDGRLRWATAKEYAMQTGRKRGFESFTLNKRQSLRDVPMEDNPLQNLFSVGA